MTSCINYYKKCCNCSAECILQSKVETFLNLLMLGPLFPFPSSIRSRMALTATQAFYLLVNNKSLASMSLTMAEVYRDYKDEDGFVYMTYASQEMFGCCSLTLGKTMECHHKT